MGDVRPATIMDSINNFIWNENFWLRMDTSWSDLENGKDGLRYPQAWELSYSIFTTLALIIIRYLLEKYVLCHLALACGLRYAPKAERNHVLDKLYKNGHTNHTDMVQIGKELNWTTRKVEQWVRKRKNESKCKVKKFSESAWKLIYYHTVFGYGLYVLMDEPWALDTPVCLGLGTWPKHGIKTEFLIYYMVELGFILSLIITLVSDIYRSDFVEQAIHHVATMILIMFSWCSNFVRIGMLVLTVHNLADSWLQLAKLSFYLKRKTLEITFLILFTIVWMASRMYYYPRHVIYITATEVYKYWDTMWPCALMLLGFLMLLQVLHVIWTYYIIKTVYKSSQKEHFSDGRSDDEESHEEEESQKKDR